MDATILLIRHARHADYGRELSGRGSGAPLSDEGVAEARGLAARLRGRGIERIETSPQARAVETGAILASWLGIAATQTAALDEIDFGHWTGMSFDALAGDPAWTAWNDARGSTSPPGGETQAAATARALSHIGRAARSGGTLAFVTHCDVIRGVVCHYLGLTFDKLLRFDIDAASVSSLIVGPWGARVTGLNVKGE